MDREKLIKHFEHLLNAAKGNYQDFVDLTVDAGEEILALLKDQEDLGTELTNAVELIHKKNERIEKLLKEQEAVKPVFDDSRPDVIGTFHCGACHSMLGFIHPFYCPHCGRKVKWE